MKFLPDYNAHLIVETELSIEEIKQDKMKYGGFGILKVVYNNEIKLLSKWFNGFGLRTPWIITLQCALKLIEQYEVGKLEGINEWVINNIKGYIIDTLSDIAENYRELYKRR
jgi:hypothetical protein